MLDGLTGWIEMHIEQARVLQDTGKRIGVVNAIAGYVHADVVVTGRGDHAGATPMGLRLDPTTVLAETVLELERLATEAGGGTVGTVGEIEVDPGLINAVAAQARFSLDVRGPEDERFQGVATTAAAFALGAAERRGMSASYEERQTLPATALDGRIVGALEAAAAATGEPWGRCTLVPLTTRCASPSASRARWCSSPARTGSATTRPRRRTPPTRRSRARSS